MRPPATAGRSRTCGPSTGRRLTTRAAPRSLWRLQLSRPGRLHRRLLVDSTVYGERTPTCRRHSSGSVALTWNGLPLPAAGRTGFDPDDVPALTVGVVLRPDAASQAIEAKLHVGNDSSRWSLDAAAWRPGGFAPLAAGRPRTALVVPRRYLGSLRPDPFTAAVRGYTGRGWLDLDAAFRYPGPQMGMQFVGLVDTHGETPGLYLATHDPGAGLKSFFFYPTAGDGFTTIEAQQATLNGVQDDGLDVDVALYAEGIGQAGNDLSQATWPLVVGASPLYVPTRSRSEGMVDAVIQVQ